MAGFAHINTAECRFSLMKRAVFGAHQSISEAHVPRYLAEWHFKFNTCKVKDGEGATLALADETGESVSGYLIERALEREPDTELAGFLCP